MIKKLLILVLAVLFLTSCSNPLASFSISSKTDTLQENGFEFKYPSDWKITSEERQSEYHRKASLYYFRHPKNKHCHVTIKVLNFSETNAVALSQNEVTSTEIRTFKDAFERSGYKNFTFQSAEIKFANQFATQITIRSRKGDTQRTTFVVVVPAKNRYYVVVYDWFDAWGVATLEKLKTIVKSFRLLA